MSREMKDSGVEWIGEIPKDWKLKKLKNISNFINGYAFKSDDLVNEGNFPVIKIGDICNGKIDFINCNKTNENNQFLDNYIIQEKDILIAMSGATVGKLGYVEAINKRAYVNQRVGILRSKCDKFLFYILSTDLFIQYILLQSAGSAQPNISTENINNYIIPFPKLEEQQKIANFLDEKVEEIDKLIDNAKKSIEEYKKYKQSIITEAVTKGLDPNVEMKDSGIEYLEEMPIHWNIVSISKIFMFIGGYAYKSEKFCQKTNYQVIRLGNVKNDELITDKKCVYINEQYAEESKKCKIKKDDILFTMTGTKGKKDYFFTLLVRESDLKNKNLYLNQRVGCFRKLNSNISMPYYNYLLKYEKIREYIFLHETGTANQGNVGIEDIKSTKVFLPPLEEQNKIVSYLDNKCFEIDSLISKKEKLISELESYKKSLIYEYVTGKKEVL